MNKMDRRIRELHSELDAENRRFADSQKNLRKSERHIKELSFAADEDRKNHERMQTLIDGLQGKIKAYKKQIEEAKRLLPSTCLNIVPPKQTWLTLEKGQISTSKHWPNSKQRLAVDLLGFKLRIWMYTCNIIPETLLFSL